MGINSEFKESLKTTTDIIHNLTLTVGDITHYNDSKTKKQNVILNGYRFLWRAHYGIYNTMVLYYNKLYIGDEDPSLIKLLNKAVNHYKGLDWYKKPDLNQLKTYLNILKECESSTLIQSLKTARDTYYAHFDKKRPSEILIETEDLNKYLITSQEIINYLLYHYEKRQYRFSFSDLERGHNMIDDLFKYRQIKMKLIHSQVTLDKEPTIDQIREIVNSKL